MVKIAINYNTILSMGIFNFFKRKQQTSKKSNESDKEYLSLNKQTNNDESEVGLSGLFTNEYFENRYEEDFISENMLEGSLKVIEGYFEANKIDPIKGIPINHPENLDKTIDDGFGFMLYAKVSGLDESIAVSILAMAFNDFLMKNHGFKLYKDSQPEYPLRGMTLKYDYEGTKLSLYPIEYSAKVINYEANYSDLYQRLVETIPNMPTSQEVYKDLIANDGENGPNEKNVESEVEQSEVFANEYFESQFEEESITESLHNGTLKLIEGYFRTNKLSPFVSETINHPVNLDQITEEGIGIKAYCEAIQIDEIASIQLLAMGLNIYLMEQLDFKLYKDSKPEYPNRGMTLIFDNFGSQISIFPVEYTLKVVNHEATFSDLFEKISSNIIGMKSGPII
ncbi:MAG: hypothetical protein ACPGVD_02365 [Flavobacteriales bacterium]